MSNISDNETDNEPDYQYLGAFDLDREGQVIAQVFQNADPGHIDELHLALHDVLDALGADLNDINTRLDMITLSASDISDEFGFDFNANTSRGGYTREEVIEFLNETGWWGISEIYYDEELDEYYIDINYEGEIT